MDEIEFMSQRQGGAAPGRSPPLPRLRPHRRLPLPPSTCTTRISRSSSDTLYTRRNAGVYIV